MGGGGGEHTPENSEEQQKRSEIYTYEAPWHIYAMNWSVRHDKRYRLVISSLLEQYPNKVEIVQLDDSTGEIRSDPNLTFDHPYPPTKAIYAGTWSDKYKDRDQKRKLVTTNQLPSSRDFLGDFMVWRPPRGMQENQYLWLFLAMWLGVVGTVLLLQR